MNDAGSNTKGRPKARLGPLSTLCFLGGLGLAFALLYLSSGTRKGQICEVVAFGIIGVAVVMSAILGVMGIVRQERPLLPSIIGFLLACGVVLLCIFPHHGPPSQLALRAVCLNSEKQILVAMTLYADDNQGRLPMDSTNPTLVGSMKLLSNVFPKAMMFYCPDDHRPGARAEADFNKLTTLNISYSYVPNLKWQDTSDSPVILDRIYSTTNGSTWPADGNHGGKGGNVGFSDGHVRWLTTLPCALKDKNGRQVVLSP
ncbi:MAG TPA: hypothetical protein VMV72_05675 [Verrucomicrobiae bacterium]|nr:hypothetical protein [Verrucomicrobiae bacterium]